MMKPIKTEHTNKTFTKPKDWDESENGKCLDLHVCNMPPYQISWWKPTIKDRIKILFGRNIRVSILGHNHPPINLVVDPDKVKEIA